MTPGTSPVFGLLQQASLVDYPGHVAVMLFLPGCNFKCGYCHNADLATRTRAECLLWPVLRERLARFRANWADACVITGGEPALHADLPFLIALLRELGFLIKLDTNGSQPGLLDQCLDKVDYVAMDLKCSPARYGELTGFSDIPALNRSVALIMQRARAYEFRTTLLPGFHDEDDIRQISTWIKGAARYVLQPFVPRDTLPDPRYRTLPRTSPGLLRQLAALATPHVRQVEVRGT